MMLLFLFCQTQTAGTTDRLVRERQKRGGTYSTTNLRVERTRWTRQQQQKKKKNSTLSRADDDGRRKQAKRRRRPVNDFAFSFVCLGLLATAVKDYYNSN